MLLDEIQRYRTLPGRFSAKGLQRSSHSRGVVRKLGREISRKRDVHEGFSACKGYLALDGLQHGTK